MHASTHRGRMPPPLRSAAYIAVALAVALQPVPLIQAIHDAPDGLPLGPGSDFDDRFGTDVAADGDVVAVGAPGADVTSTGGTQTEAGAVRVFIHDAGGWTLSSVLTASTPDSDEELGASVSISGAWLAAGAPEASAGAGEVHLYRRSPGGWVHHQTLTPLDGLGGGRFGASVDLAGTTLAVGAPGESTVHVFRLDAATGSFSPWQLLRGSGGASVDLESDHLFAGDLGRGEVHVYRLDRTDDRWDRVQVIEAEAFQSDFGRSVHASGTVLAVGAPDPVGDTGTVDVYHLGSLGTWLHVQRLFERNDDGDFGTSVAVDGDVLAVGNPEGDATDDEGFFVGDSGTVELFTYGTNGDETWNRAGTLHPPDPRWFARMGTSVDLSSGTLVAGAPGWEGGKGEAYAYDRRPVAERVDPAVGL